MSIATILPQGEQQFSDANGIPFDGGFVYMYVAPNTTTFKDTWTDRDHSILNSNPIVLDSAGRAIIFGLGRYRQVLKDQFGTQIWDEQVEAMVAEADVTSIVNTAIAAGTIYDLPVFIEGLPGASEEFPIFNIVRDCHLPAGLTGAIATIDTNPTAALVMTMNKNGSSIGTISYATNGVATITFSAQVAFSPGDQFSLVAPVLQDGTGAGIAITIPFTVD